MNPGTPNENWAFCDAILPDVSRSFALIIPKCPPPLDRAMCTGYLICRIADTIEDDANLTVQQRSALYDALLSAVGTPENAAKADAFVALWRRPPEGAYGRLVGNMRHVLGAYRTLPDAIRAPVAACVRDMVAGMRQVQPVEHANGIAFMCRDPDDLERYCHHVAGTVGIMSTALFETRVDPSAFATPADEWRERGRRLGLGLQMTNIIKDCRVDAVRGVSYIPAACVDLTQPQYRLLHIGRADLVGRAIGHLDAGLAYTLAIPAGEPGIRTFLLGSLLPAVATLELAAPGTEYHPTIPREQMAEILAFIDAHVRENDPITDWYNQRRRRTLAALNQ